jgi:four helix bundle protein
MFLQLNHKSLTVYQATRDLAVEVCNVSRLLPTEEKYNMVPQMRRAVLSVKLNLAEGQAGNPR